MYEKYSEKALRDILFLEERMKWILRGVDEVREWEDMGMGGSFLVRRKRGVLREEEGGPARS